MLTSMKVGGHQNLWTRKMLGIEMAVEVQILQQILQDLQVILQKMILRYWSLLLIRMSQDGHSVLKRIRIKGSYLSQ